LERAFKSKNGAEIQRLYSGDHSAYPSQSEADLSLCSHLAFWFDGDTAAMDSAFRESGLFREKWDVKHHGDGRTYGEATIEIAIANCKSFYCDHQAQKLSYEEESPQKAEAHSKNESFIDELNNKHAAISIGGRFCILNEIIDPELRLRKIDFSSPADFKYFYANRFTSKPHPRIKDKMIEICVADEWLQSKDRRQYEGLVFEPGQDVSGYYNLWRGFAVTPEAGDWSLMHNHIFEIICRSDKSIFRWVMAWLARIVQYPGGNRPGTCIVLIGGQGVGKGILAREFGSFFGWHFLHLLSINQLTGRFNAHLSNVLFVFCDEALWDGSRNAEGVIKGIITEPTFPVEFKGKDIFKVRNHANVMIASNSSWVVPAGEKERRFCVLDVSSDKAGDIQYFKAIMDQMNNGGREAMLHELLHSDISSIDLRIIPKTTALTDQAIRNLESVPKFWLHCLTNPDCLPEINKGGRFCVRKSDLYEIYCDFCKKTNERTVVPDNSFGKAIRKYCPSIQDGRSSPDEQGKKPTCYILPPLTECRSHFEKVIGMAWVFEP
jgi:hypothetical protein